MRKCYAIKNVESPCCWIWKVLLKPLNKDWRKLGKELVLEHIQFVPTKTKERKIGEPHLRTTFSASNKSYWLGDD